MGLIIRALPFLGILLLVFAAPARADVTVVNATTCVVPSSADGKVSCPLVKAPAPGNVLMAATAGAGGGKCAIFVAAFTIVDAAPEACYQSSYFVVGEQPPDTVTIVNPGGVDALVAVVLEISGVILKGSIIDWNVLFTGLSPNVICPGSAPKNTGDGVFYYAVSVGLATVKGYATTPDTPATSYSAVAAEKNPVRIDVGFSVLPEKFPIISGAFTYSGETSSACGLAMLAGG